jgi:hypothetical protein
MLFCLVCFTDMALAQSGWTATRHDRGPAVIGAWGEGDVSWELWGGTVCEAPSSGGMSLPLLAAVAASACCTAANGDLRPRGPAAGTRWGAVSAASAAAELGSPTSACCSDAAGC